VECSIHNKLNEIQGDIDTLDVRAYIWVEEECGEL
jgi:hypothetical protein